MKKILLSLAAATALTASASQPLRRYVTMTTDTGQSVSVARYGSSDFSWWADAEGTCYTFDAENGHLKAMSKETFLATLAAVHEEVRSRGPKKSFNASTSDGLGAYGQSGNGVVKSLGSPTLPVIMVAFADRDFMEGHDKDKLTRFFNEEGYHDERLAVGSVTDYFRHSSYGAFTPRFEVVGKVTLSKDYKYYGVKEGNNSDAHRHEAAREAMALAAEQGIDFSKFATDGRGPLVCLMHAGPGEHEDMGLDGTDFLWAHYVNSSLSANNVTFNSYLISNETIRYFDDNRNVVSESMTGIGTFCHELSHALGIPDMYDTNGATDGDAKTPSYWDVMDYQFMYDGFRPMEYSGYERSMMGWLKVEDLNMDDAEKTYCLKALDSDDAEGHKMYRIVNPANRNEYVLLENRQKSLFYQSGILGKGMLAWHISYDSSRWASNKVNTSASKLLLHVIPADGAWQKKEDIALRDENNNYYTFAGDLFPGYESVTILDNSLDSHLSSWFESSIRNISVDANGDVTFTFGSVTTGLDDATSQGSASVGSYYDLQGRKVVGKGGKGVYVKDGIKIINK